ncbi:hypothetical protein SAMN05421820_101874 [Pedobacter steynii]|uniref:VWFA domain-containing protein n=1 Tax=Pedobacter steynii TaxID=430522 RepID=A0A1G9LG83_9SPHI|nr:hypothetical protein [Pedobacter steynii]NQX38835.1 hypothetical protein [Pedobacter steynii]SDL60783.1 hypothetical protein SAMN05421820_101874 [Pedobacter steynii]
MSEDNRLLANALSSQIAAENSASTLFGLKGMALSPLAYAARVTRKNPCAFVLLLDQSFSMSSKMSNGISRAQVVTDIVNDMLENLIMKCQRDSIVREYFDVMVIGYGKTEGSQRVSFGWEGNLEGRSWVNISELKNNVYKTDVVATQKQMPWGLIPNTQTKKIWINPYSVANTPMKEALRLCREELLDWTAEHPESFPPMVFNITDGFPTDVATLKELVDSCEEIKKTGTDDGQTLLFNCLITDGVENILPSHGTALGFEGNDFHMSLYEGASFLPHELKKMASKVFGDERFVLGRTKGVILNSTASSLINLLTIGTMITLANVAD